MYSIWVKYAIYSYVTPKTWVNTLEKKGILFKNNKKTLPITSFLIDLKKGKMVRSQPIHQTQKVDGQKTVPIYFVYTSPVLVYLLKTVKPWVLWGSYLGGLAV